MEYIYILAEKTAQNIAVFDNILQMFPEVKDSGRYSENVRKKEPGEQPPDPFGDPPIRTGPFFLLIKAEKESFDPALMTGVESPYILPTSSEVHLNFWT